MVKHSGAALRQLVKAAPIMVWLYVLCVVNDSRKHIVEQWIGIHSRADQQHTMTQYIREERKKNIGEQENHQERRRGKKKKIKWHKIDRIDERYTK